VTHLPESETKKVSWRRFIKGLGANAFGQIVTIIVQIVSVPIFIRFWGVEKYGEWLILTSIVLYFTLSDVGFGSAAANEMTMRVSQGDREAALSIFQSVWLLIDILILIILLIILTIIWFLPLSSWLNLTHISNPEAMGIILLLAMEALIGQHIGIALAGFQCEGNYGAGILFFNVVRLLAFGSVSVAVCLGASPLIAAFVLFCIFGMGTLGMLLDLRRRSPWLSFGFQYANLSDIKRLTAPAVTIMGFPVGQAIVQQGMTIVIGTTLGPASVTLFSVLRTLSRTAWQMLNIVNNSIRPELSVALGTGDLPLARTLHRRSCQTAFWLALVTVSGLFFTGEWIFRTWTGYQMTFDPTLFHLMLLVIMANSLWNTSQAVPISINKHQPVAIRYLLSTLCALLLAVLFIPMWGLQGVAMSQLLIDIVMSIYVLRVSLMLLQDNLIPFMKSMFQPLPISKLLGKLISS
jgi:O-antigen/teichoic acid export membrane protein